METLSSEKASPLLALSNDLAGAVEQVGRAVVAVHARSRIPSSGVHWQPGVIVTAAHTVTRDEEISVTLPDGRTAPATLAGRDTSTDLAVLRLEKAECAVAALGDASVLKVGHLVLAVGRLSERGPSASLGVISAVSGPWRTWRGGVIDRFVRPDLTLYPGFSGGPLVHADGRVMGINTSGLSRSFGLSIPASTVQRVTEALLQKGRIARGYLGVGMHPVRLPDTLRSSLNIAGRGGVVILSVEADAPAGKAGLLIGDILIAFDGEPIGDTDDVQGALGPERVGKTVRASVIRGGARVELDVAIGERPWRK